MAFDIGTLTAAQQTQLAYTAFYARAADPQGFDFWEPLLDGGAVSFSQLADSFFNQAETRQVYDLEPSDTTTADLDDPFLFLQDVYQNLFGRNPEAAGVTFWANVLESGVFTIGEVIVAIVEGAQAADVAALENRIEAGLDWKDAADAAGITTVDPINPDPNYDAAMAALDGVTNDPATLDDAKAGTDVFFNDAPDATDDAESVDEDDSVTIDVLANDTDADGDALTVTSVGAASNGTVVNNNDGTVTYTPNADYNGPDSFTYTVSDGKGGTDTATVNVNVDAVNDTPVAADDAGSTVEDTAVTIDVLANDTDIDGDALTVTSVGAASNGTVVNNNDGTVTYTPNVDYDGPDSFTYTVSDGNGGFSTATVNVTVNDVSGQTFILTSGVDGSPAFDGTEGDDTYLANQGTLNNSDSLNGVGTGVDNDLLKVSIQSGTGDFFAAPTLNGIETIEVNGPNLASGQDITIDLSNASGYETLRSFQTTTGNGTGNLVAAPSYTMPLVSFLDIQNVNETNLEIIDTNADHLFTYDSNAFDSLFGGADDTANILLQEVDGSTIDLALENPVPGTPGGDFRSHVDTVRIDSQERQQQNTTDFNYVYDLNVGPVFTTLEVVGNADLEIELFLEGPTAAGGGVIGGVNTVNAVELDGDLDLDLIGQGQRVDLAGGPSVPNETQFNITGGSNALNPSGVLTVVGAKGDNDIIVAGDTNGLFTFQGGDDSLVVGVSTDMGIQNNPVADFIEPVFGNSTVDSGAGTDGIFLYQTGVQDVDLGADNDFLLIEGNVDNLSTYLWNDGVSQVNAGAGDDDVFLSGVVPADESNGLNNDPGDVADLDNNYVVDLGDGDDLLVVNGGGELNVLGGAGDDEVFVEGNGNQTIDTGEDDDFVQIVGDGTHDILLGGGDDVLDIFGSRITGNNVDSVGLNVPTNIDAGAGDDTIRVFGDHMLNVLLGDGEDSIELNTDELTVDDFIDGGNADGDAVDDTVILRNTSGNVLDGNVGRSETSSIIGVEVFDLRDTNITLALSSDNFDSSVDKKITVKTPDVAQDVSVTAQLFSPSGPGEMVVDITDIPMSVASGRTFELQGGTIKDVIIADDAAISSRLTLDFDRNPDFENGDDISAPIFDSREDTLQVIDSATITAADQQNFSGLDIIELLADSNQAQTWVIEVTENTVNQSSDDAPFKIVVDPNVGAGSVVIIDVDPSTYTASMDDPLIIETVANAEIYIDFNDGNGPQLIGEPLWGTELLGNAGLNVPFGGGIFVQERLLFTQNTDSLNGDQSFVGQNDTFIVDSMSKLQNSDSADGKDGFDTLLFDNVTVSNQGQDIEDQINNPQLTSIEHFKFDTGMNVQATQLDDGDGNLQNMLDTVTTGWGNDDLRDMETIGDNQGEGYFLRSGDDQFISHGDEDLGGFGGLDANGTSNDDYYVDGGIGDDTVTMREEDNLFGTDIETIFLYDGSDELGGDADLRTIQGVDGSSMTVYGDEQTTNSSDDSDNNDVDLDSSITKRSDGSLATVFLYDIQTVDDFGGDQIIVLDNNQGGPDGDADIDLNDGTDNLTVTNVDDLVVTATSGDKTVSIGEAGGAVDPVAGGGTRPNSNVNDLDYTGGSGVDDVTAVVDDDATVNGNLGDDILNVTSTQAGAVIVNGGDGDDLITARSIGGTVTTTGGDGADTFFVRTELGETSSIDTGLGADDTGDVVNLYFPDLVAGGDPFAGQDTIVFGTIVYDTTQEIVTEDNTLFPARPFTTQNFIQNGIDSAEIDGVNDSIDTVNDFNMETLGNAEDVIDVDAFIQQFGGDDDALGVDSTDFGYGDWTGGGQTAQTKVGSAMGAQEIAVIEVDNGFELDASHIKVDSPSPDAGIYIADNDGRVVVTAYDTDNDGSIDTADIYLVQDVDQDAGQAWAVDKVATINLATEIGAISSIDEDNFFFTM